MVRFPKMLVNAKPEILLISTIFKHFFRPPSPPLYVMQYIEETGRRLRFLRVLYRHSVIETSANQA